MSTDNVNVVSGVVQPKKYFLNIIWTLLIAYLLFGGILFPEPDIQ